MESGSGETNFTSVHDPYSTDSGSDFNPNEIDLDSSSDTDSVVAQTGKRKRNKSDILKPADDENQLNFRRRIAKNAILDGKFFEVRITFYFYFCN